MTTLAQNAVLEQTAVVAFNGALLITVKIQEIVYVAMRPIVEALGLDWITQIRKLTGQKSRGGHMPTPSESRYGHMTTPLQTTGGIQEMVCIPLRKLNGWLFSINPEKVRPDLKGKVIQYQEECFEVLYRYWQGEVVQRLSSSQDCLISQTLNQISAGNRKLYMTMYNGITRHFRVSKLCDIPAGETQKSIAVIYALAVEWHRKNNPVQLPFKFNDGQHYIVAKDGVVIWEKTLKADCSDIPASVTSNPQLMLEHIRQVVGDFVGKQALPAPAPERLPINYPASWVIDNNKPVLRAENRMFSKLGLSLHNLTNPDFRLPTREILNTLKKSGYCVEAAEAELFALYNQLAKCFDQFKALDAMLQGALTLTDKGIRQYSTTWPVIPA